MSTEPWNWTKGDLDKLLGQTESIRLDFKASALMQKQLQDVIDELTETVSAFANTEGGTIVIGIVERREGKACVADHLDGGVSLEHWAPEQLQQTIEGNISPHLVGLRVRAIPLARESKNCAYVIHVPQGTTAYQASDKRYYGRSEYECKALPDYQIRLIMFRGKLPSAVVKTATWQTASEEVTARSALQGGSYPGAITTVLSRLQPDDRCIIRRYWCDVDIENTGEINITEFKVHLTPHPVGHCAPADRPWTFKDGWPDNAGFPYTVEPGASKRPMMINIYPRDTYRLTALEVFTTGDKTLRELDAVLEWTLNLSNTLPVSGRIDLAQAFEDNHIPK